MKWQPATDQSHALLGTLETVNLACNALSKSAWEIKEFRRFRCETLLLHVEGRFSADCQIVVRLISKVSDAYKLDQKVQREFRPHGSISYDLRVLSWNMSKETVSIWSLDGRLSIPFICGEHHPELLNFQRGETDWFIAIKNGSFTTVDVPDQKEREAIEWMGVDMGIVSIAETSDGARFAGSTVNSRRARNARLRRKLQKKATKSAKRLMRRRRRKERRFAADVNHQISKKIVGAAQRTESGIALEDLKGIRARVRASKKQRRSLHSWSFDQLQGFILYKAKRAGVPVRFVDPRNTSRTCGECGCVDKRNRKGQAVFHCVACGHTDNADSNAAREISRRAAVNRPNVAGVDVSGVHRKSLCVAKRKLRHRPFSD